MSVDKYFKQNLAAMDKNLKRDLADNETLHANQAKVIKENYGLEIDTKNQAYDDDLRENEVQKYINMREVAENNANLGLTDSGLNRTQSTAVQLSASNNAAKIERDRNNMVRSLETEMNRYLTEIENSRISSAASIQKGYEDSAMSSAVDMYKADVNAAAKKYQADVDAAAKAKELWKATGTYDDYGNPIFINSNGKTQAFGTGINPYTGTKHSDSKNGTFSNGYQPNNIGGTKLNNSGLSTNITGKNQTIWEANGKYWLWRGDLNKYVEVDISDLD